MIIIHALRFMRISFVLLIFMPHPANSTDIEHLSCPDTIQENIREAVQQFILKEFSDENVLFSIKAINDIRCEKPEDMANIVIVVMLNTRESFYGIFHLHFLHSTTTFKSASSFDDKNWTLFTNDREWNKQWCTIIGLVYKNELEQQNCI